MIFDSSVSGIPCQVKVDYFFEQKPLGPSADSDYDCYGYFEINFTVLDRKGYDAPWLQRKLTDDDVSRIEQQIIDYQRED